MGAVQGFVKCVKATANIFLEAVQHNRGRWLAANKTAPNAETCCISFVDWSKRLLTRHGRG